MIKRIMLLCFLSLTSLTLNAEENVNNCNNITKEEQVNIEIQNKQIVMNFFKLFSAGDAKQAFNLVDPDVVWWVPESLPFGGTYNKTGYLTKVLSKFSGFQKPLQLTVKSMISDGDSVAAEVESYAVHICGDPEPFVYNNKYHFKITLKDGKFVEVKEYMDTHHLSKLYNLIQSEPCKSKRDFAK